MTLLLHYLTIALFILLSSILYGNEGFEKNEGQFKHPDGTTNHDVLFGFKKDGLKVTLRKGGFSYEFTSVEDSSWKNKVYSIKEDFSFVAKQERIDFLFPDTPSEVLLKDELDYFSIYHRQDEKLIAKHYRKIIYKDVVDGFDVVFKIGANGFKYDILKRKGVSLENFYLTIGTAASVKEESNKLKFSLSNAIINEALPYSYDAESLKELNVQFDLRGQQLFFQSKKDLTNVQVVVDPEPNMVWSSFWGGNQYDLITDIALSQEDTIYAVGMTMSTNNIATSGAYQTSYLGDLDIFISKFSNDGNLSWSTYYNGPQTERVYAVSTDENNDIFVAGCTFSTTGIITAGAQQTMVNGNDDIFILKMRPDGTRDWCTYHGGNGHDFVTDMHVENDTVYMVGHTTSSDIIASSGAHVETFSANEAGHITLFSGSGSFLWGTYFGTENNNSIEGVAVTQNRIYITGRSNGTVGIATSGGYQENLAGYTNAFVSSFSKNGNQIWGSYFGGQYTDVATDIALDSLEGLYIAGNASSDNNIGTAGAYQETRLSSEQGFIAHFDKDGSLYWSTYTGGTGSDYVNVINSRKNGKIYVGGYTNSTEMITSPNVYQPNPGGSYDGFIQQFDFNGNYQWGTFLGGTGSEDLLSLELTSSNNIVVAGSTDQNDTIFGTGNSLNNQYNGGAIDGYIAYLCESLTPTIYYSNDSLHTIEADHYEWFLDGQPLNIYSQSIEPVSDGIYTVEISSSDKCQTMSDEFDYSTVGINQSQTESVLIYPNPADAIINVKSESFSRYLVTDLTGREVLTFDCPGSCSVNISGLRKGIYYIMTTNNTKTRLKTLIKL